MKYFDSNMVSFAEIISEHNLCMNNVIFGNFYDVFVHKLYIVTSFISA